MEKLWIPRSVKARKSKSKVKVMPIVFFDIQGIVHFEFLPQGQTVSQTIYKEFLHHLIRSVHDKRQSFWEANAWTLHYDNAPARTILSIRQFFTEKNIATFEHPDIPLIWPHVTFFSSLYSNCSEETYFSDINSIKMTELKKIPKMPSTNFLNCGKGECTSVFKWKGITLKEFDFGILQYFSIKFL